LFTSVLAVALFVGAPPGVFVDQNSFDNPHEVSLSAWSPFLRTHQTNLCTGY
jgi:hypothetical protein